MDQTYEIYCKCPDTATPVLYATTDNQDRAQCLIEAMNAWQGAFQFYWKETNIL